MIKFKSLAQIKIVLLVVSLIFLIIPNLFAQDEKTSKSWNLKKYHKYKHKDESEKIKKDKDKYEDEDKDKDKDKEYKIISILNNPEYISDTSSICLKSIDLNFNQNNIDNITSDVNKVTSKLDLECKIATENIVENRNLIRPSMQCRTTLQQHSTPILQPRPENSVQLQLTQEMLQTKPVIKIVPSPYEEVKVEEVKKEEVIPIKHDEKQQTSLLPLPPPIEIFKYTEMEFEENVINKLDKVKICQYKVLKDFGWKIDIKEGNDTTMDTKKGDACSRKDITQINNEKDLQINISCKKGQNKTDTIKELTNKIIKDDYFNDLLNSRDALCVYKLRLKNAIKEATKKLTTNTDNNNYQFSEDDDQPFCDAPEKEWHKEDRKVKGKLNPRWLMPKNNPAKAIETFYCEKCIGECAVGLQVALLASQKELYKDSFNDAFTKDEVVIGDYDYLEQTNNPFFSLKYKNYLIDPKGEQMAKEGAATFIGVPGYIGHIRKEKFLDSKVDIGENFMLVDISKLASEEIKKYGMDYFNKINHDVWMTNLRILKLVKEQEMIKAEIKKIKEIKNVKESEFNDAKIKLLNDDLEKKEKKIKILKDKIEDLLNRPFFKEIEIYVHPLGVMTFGEHIKRLLRINKQSDYKIYFYQDSTNTALFKRYIDFMVHSCLKVP
ncbi:MAG: hypothetical protein HQK49_09795 [Oligoflexia bacterium]|nr:hypothetical protein [Oligoflexia bacterium]